RAPREALERRQHEQRAAAAAFARMVCRGGSQRHQGPRGLRRAVALLPARRRLTHALPGGLLRRGAFVSGTWLRSVARVAGSCGVVPSFRVRGCVGSPAWRAPAAWCLRFGYVAALGRPRGGLLR